MIDIDKIRAPNILLHGLTKADAPYTFYYDETNNIRRLRLKPHGVNVPSLQVFVLGGVGHAGAPRPLDIQPLRKAMCIQKSAPEIKLEQVAKGDFLALLGSAKLRSFLAWIADNDLMIHYHALDPFYWSIVDIIDSILPNLGDPDLFSYHAVLKSGLATILRQDLPAAYDLFHRHDYPGVHEDRRQGFLEDLTSLVEKRVASVPPLDGALLLRVLRAGHHLPTLQFIEGNAPHLLIDNFSAFYINRIALFKYATHVLDEEPTIEKLLLETPLVSDGRPVSNYRFANSTSEAGLQISDVIVGLLGKMHTYFTRTSPDQIAEVRASMTGISEDNAKLLRDLISAAHKETRALLHHVTSLHDVEKIDLFLRFEDGAYSKPAW